VAVVAVTTAAKWFTTVSEMHFKIVAINSLKIQGDSALACTKSGLVYLVSRFVWAAKWLL
jgi:hypothetical protein